MIRTILTVSLILMIAACDDSPQSPQANTSISGTVVFDQSGSPAADVDVMLQRCQQMMGDRWDQVQHMKTDSQGRFHFEYMHESMHRYRVGVPGISDWHMCDGSHDDGVVLRIPSQGP